MLPPEVGDQSVVGIYWSHFHERPLWVAAARRGYRSRLRLTMQGIAARSASIRIDERADGRLTGHVVIVTRGARGRYSTRREKNFMVTQAQMAALQQGIARARLWEIHPQFWNGGPDMICIDGIVMVFERVNAEGYRFATANAQCTATAQLHDVARQFFDLARESDLRHLLE